MDRTTPNANVSAPAIPPMVPANETAPERPGFTRFPVVINTGGRADSAPISVAHVSAVTAANAPEKAANQKFAGVNAWATIAAAGSPPLANTCSARRPSPSPARPASEALPPPRGSIGVCGSFPSPGGRHLGQHSAGDKKQQEGQRGSRATPAVDDESDNRRDGGTVNC